MCPQHYKDTAALLLVGNVTPVQAESLSKGRNWDWGERGSVFCAPGGLVPGQRGDGEEERLALPPHGL